MKGATNKAGTTGVEEVIVWFSALNSTPKDEGNRREYLGGVINDEALWRWTYKARLIPFAYQSGGMEGHDHQLYLQLMRKVMSKPYKFIKAVTGPEKVDDDGVSLFWAAALVSEIPVALVGYQQEDPDDGTLLVTLSFEHRYRGL